MTERKLSRDEFPLWVRFGLWGLRGRASVWAFVWLSIACSVGCVIYGFWDARFFVGSLFLFAALMYWLTIRWVDRHGEW
jgi:hypothetical protein